MGRTLIKDTSIAAASSAAVLLDESDGAAVLLRAALEDDVEVVLLDILDELDLPCFD